MSIDADGKAYYGCSSRIHMPHMAERAKKEGMHCPHGRGTLMRNPDKPLMIIILIIIVIAIVIVIVIVIVIAIVIVIVIIELIYIYIYI